jgi:pyruvate dehydrogenase E1 component
MATTVDGDFQRYAVESGAYIRDHFFGPDPRLRKMVEHLSDDELRNLPRGGHDYRKLYAAYKAATEQEGAPTVILAKTIKGWTLGPDVEGRNATHQIKKMTSDQLRALRDRIHLDDEVPDEALADDRDPPYIRPPADSPEMRYMHERRAALDGSLPTRVVRTRRPLTLPGDEAFDEVLQGSGKQAASTTTAFTRLLRNLCRHDEFGPRVVPIIPDEARTFGMDALFKEFGIYASQGQQYEPVDHNLLLAYRESKSGQILEEGITEAGATSSFIAAATSYATHGVPMVPFFTFYSMFGFQRVGDLIWQAADQRARGFLLGATAGRTTLLGEGLQHQDGHSLLLAATHPAVEAYDPAFAYEAALVIRHGLHRMYGEGVEGETPDVLYYLTLYNENYPMPPMPDSDGDRSVADGVIDGLYRWAAAPDGPSKRATILFSGSAQGAARGAQAELAERWDVAADLWSATSYKRLREQALDVDRWNRLHPGESPRTPLVTELLAGGDSPVVAVSDFMAAVPDQVGRWIGRPWSVLGTDGFGRSDTREQLRRYFEVDTGHVVVATLSALAATGEVKSEIVTDAIRHHDIDPDRVPPRLP